MCIFSNEVISVGETKIFARSSTNNKQFLVYSMKYEADSDLAMILPLPTIISPKEDAVRFIDLSNYPRFFDDMNKGFEQPKTRSLPSYNQSSSKSTLQVYNVGSFEASFVPHQNNFARLDQRFRLPHDIWQQLPAYHDYGFAVFKLKAGALKIHPMAFEFPRRNKTELFFPTIHIHHEKVEPTAEFNHDLYCQTNKYQLCWLESMDSYLVNTLKAKDFMNISQTQGIVNGEMIVQKVQLNGVYPNQDIIVREDRQENQDIERLITGYNFP